LRHDDLAEFPADLGDSVDGHDDIGSDLRVTQVAVGQGDFDLVTAH
jgi:hypothetical protein